MSTQKLLVCLSAVLKTKKMINSLLSMVDYLKKFKIIVNKDNSDVEPVGGFFTPF